VLLDYHLQKLGISGSSIEGYEKEVFTHFEVGLAVLSKEADAGIATSAISQLLGLSFVPITRESFDMILNKNVFFEKGIQALIEILNSAAFRTRVANLGNYDFNKSGKIIYSNN
jgi:putative molybdopterin biosynthesis protein